MPSPGRAATPALGPNRPWRLLLHLAKHQVEPDTMTGAAVRRLGRVGHWDLALCFQRRSLLVFNSAINACASCSLPGKALRLLADLRRGAWQPDAASWSAAVFAARKSWRTAMGLVTQLRRQLCWDLDVRVRRGQSCAVLGAGCYLGASNAALKACALGKRWRNALDLLTNLWRCGVRGNRVTAALGSPSRRLARNGWRQQLRWLPMATEADWMQALNLLSADVMPDPAGLGVVMDAGQATPKLAEELSALGMRSLRQKWRAERPLDMHGYVLAAVNLGCSKTLVVTDSVLSIPEDPPELLLDPGYRKALAYHARDAGDAGSELDIEDAKVRRKGWARIALFATFFNPGALANGELRVPEADATRPWQWQPGWEESFRRLRQNGRPLVAPIIRELILKQQPEKTRAYVDRIASWNFVRVVSAHFDCPIPLSPAQFRNVFDFVTKDRPRPLPYCSEDVSFLSDLQKSAIPDGQAVQTTAACGFQQRAA
ncbi:unnamed protein product [Effrenium voratum]|nr:unnamed protein product [Effrenium voratum]